jgi:predicted nucleic acid-binding protein
MRCLIDSMIFDRIADDPAAAALVDRLTRARRLELLAATASMAQVAATPDRERRRRLQRVRVLVVPPAGGDPAGRRLMSALRGAPGVDREDAAIAAAAVAAGAPLATEDRALQGALAERAPQVTVWDWSRGLAPRIAALAEANPAPPPPRGR